MLGRGGEGLLRWKQRWNCGDEGLVEEGKEEEEKKEKREGNEVLGN